MEELKNVNTARAVMFKTGKQLEDSLPPNQDSLKLHLYRANYQTAIHRKCLEQFPNIPNPDGYGWVLEDDLLQVKWMELPCAPNNQCSCQKFQCLKNSCSCLKNDLKCTDLCKCTDCYNFQHTDLASENKDLQEDSDCENDIA